MKAGDAQTSTPSVHVPTEPINGFTTIWGITINPMVIILAVLIIFIVFVIWYAHRRRTIDLWDLLRDDVNGKTSKTAIAFLTAFLMTSWVIIDREIKATLDVTFFAAYLAAWVGPLTAKIIFNKAGPETRA
jgi:hypothetical protein